MSQTKSLTKKNIHSKPNLPTLQNSIMVSKTMLAISKVDLDSRMIYKQQIQPKSMSRQENRSYSAMMKRNQSKSKLIQTTSKFLDKKIGNQKIITVGDSLNQMKTQLTKNIRIQKSKISSKSHGIVKAYAANSHPGPYNSINEDRVCIATNLTKTSIKNNQISFFAIYDGNNGCMMADFMRDRFHHLLTEDQSFSKDMETSIKNTIRKLQNYYDNDPIYSKNISDLVIKRSCLGSFGYCVQMGDPKLIISKNLGEQCLLIFDKVIEGKSKNRNSSFRRIQFGNNNLNKISMPNLHFQSQFRQGKIVNIKQIQINQNIDFILMGSEGLFESIKDVDLMRKIWKSLVLNQSQDNIHARIGEAANSLYTQVFNTISTKNVSLILIGFQSLVQLIKKDQKILLPFINEINQ